MNDCYFNSNLALMEKGGGIFFLLSNNIDI